MAKNKKSLSDIVKQMQMDLSSDSTISNYIPDIITFCESKEYLNLKEQGIEPYPVQKLILKVFFRGSIGNENLTLTEDEIKLCHDLGLIDRERGSIIDKFDSGEIFRELVLVWGRRSGKDFMSGIIISYEAMRLLECNGGDPYKIYKLSPSNPISLLTIATAAPQAGIAFQEIKSKIVNSKYFKDKIAFEGIESTKIHLLTPCDKAKNKEFIANGLPPTKGSIVIEVGHSNSDSLLGKQCFILLLDEVASYKQTGGSSSGERIHSALTPSLNTFVRDNPVLDENGNQTFDDNGKLITQKVLDSKLICISSPRGEEGLFYRLYKEAHLQDDRLMCKLPTWLVNTNLPEQFLRDNNKSMTAEDFMMEYGAEFSGTGGESMFVREKVLDCFKAEVEHKEMGQTGNIYFAHLDPATTSHNYALVIIHRENFFDKVNKVADFKIIVDHIKFWHPTPGSPIRIDEVDDYVIGLKKRFYLGMVTYDVWNSIQSIEKLKKHGIPAKCTHYSPSYKQNIYNQLEVIINAGKLYIPRHKLLKDEMLHLQRKYTVKGFRVQPPKEGDVRTDDLIDALAGAVYSSMNVIAHRLPGGKLVSMTQSPGSNNTVWRSMQGVPYGTGSGAQVAKAMETRQPNRGGKGVIPPSIFNP